MQKKLNRSPINFFSLHGNGDTIRIGQVIYIGFILKAVRYVSPTARHTVYDSAPVVHGNNQLGTINN